MLVAWFILVLLDRKYIRIEQIARNVVRVPYFSGFLFGPATDCLRCTPFDTGWIPSMLLIYWYIMLHNTEDNNILIKENKATSNVNDEEITEIYRS